MTSVDRSDVRQALRDLDRHGRTHVTARDVAETLDLGTGAHRSIGHRLRQLSDQGALDRWSPPNVSNGVTWELVDPDAGLEVATDGGRQIRECHACGEQTTAGRCDECHARPWTDEPLVPDGESAAVAAELRTIADRIDVREVKEIRTDGGVEVADDSDPQPELDPATRAYVHLLRACGLSYRNIADRLDLAYGSVESVCQASARRVKRGEDPVDVYAEVLAPIHGLDPDHGLPGGDA